MSERMADVQLDIARTRERISETIAELDARISERVTGITERLDVMQLAEEHPWPALAVALGVGVLLAGTAADAKVARATVRAAKEAPGATVDLARRGSGAVASVVRRGRGDGDGQVSEGPSLADRVRRAIRRATGVEELLGQMQAAAASLARPASRAAQDLPRREEQRM